MKRKPQTIVSELQKVSEALKDVASDAYFKQQKPKNKALFQELSGAKKRVDYVQAAIAQDEGGQA